MRPQRTWARFGVPAAAALAAAALAGAALSSPAHAEETPSPQESQSSSPTSSPTTRPEPTQPQPKPAAADIAVRIATDKVAVDSKGKVMRVDLANHGPDAADTVTLTLDLSGLNSQVQVLPHEDKSCARQGKTITCSYEKIRAGATRVTAFRIKPVDGAKPGSAGKVKAAVKAGNVTDPATSNNTDSAAVQIVDSAVDLVAAAEDVGPVKPGGTGVLTWALANQGDTAAKGITLKFSLPAYAKFTDSYRECTYSKNRRDMVCEAPDAVMQPGQLIMWNDEGVRPVHVKVAADAPGPISLGHGQFVASAHGEIEPQPVAASGDTAMLAPAESRSTSQRRAKDVDGDDNSATFAVLTKENPADLAVSASKAAGKVGDTVQVRVTVRNHGPADANGFEAKIALPTGTRLVGVPKACSLDKADRTLHCRAGDFLDKGKSAHQDLKLKISSEERQHGWVRVSTNQIPDQKQGNNKAEIRIAEPSGGSGGGLPVTGVSLTAAIGGGAAAVLLGATLFLLARRRRAVDNAG